MATHFDFLLKNMKAVSVKGQSYLTYTNLPVNLYQSLRSSASLHPLKIALATKNESITYSEILKRVDQLAAGLYSDYGLRKGDVCALLAVNSIDFCVAFYALQKIGAVALPMSTKLTSAELLHPLQDSGARLIIADDYWVEKVKPLLNQTNIEAIILTGEGVDKPKAKRLRQIAAETAELSEPQWEDTAVLMYTSGTTGKPKGAVISQFNILHGIESYHRALKLDDSDSTVISVPIFHITGLAALLGLFVHIGGTIHLLPTFDARETLRIIRDEHITFFHASPTVFILLLEEKEDFPTLPSLKKAACGSAHLPISVIHELHTWVPQLKMHVVYGLTETSSPATIMPGDPVDLNKLGSSGIPIPGLDLRIIDQKTREFLGPNLAGELEVKGSVVVERYLNTAGDTNKAFHDGWFNTGDIARVDEDGFVYILDRKRDMINRGGEKVFSIEVENAINDHPDVIECAVIGVPDPIYGEAVKAYIHLKDNVSLSSEEINDHLKKRLAKYKLPAEYEFVKELPRTDSGKINKNALRSDREQVT